MLDIKRVIGAMPRKHEPEEPAPLTTPWTENVRQAADQGIPPLAEHPHPQFCRDSYQTLNGWWDFTIVTLQDMSAAQASWPSTKAPSPPSFDSRILVPFSPEAPLSGVGRQVMPQDLAWYRRTFDAPEMAPGDECLLHFEAVDYACAVFLNGVCLGTHTGGHLPFSFSVGSLLQPQDNELLVRVWDPSDAGTQLRGKQKLERGGIWYTAQSGIWQSVWLEVVPTDHLVSLRMETWVLLRLLHLEVEIAGSEPQALEVQILDAEGQVVAHKSDKGGGNAGDGADNEDGDGGSSASTPSSLRKMDIFLPEVHPWSPDDPYLYDLVITYGKDQIHSYCGFRTVATRPVDDGRSRFQLNNEPLLLEGVLDQGYWPDGLMTAPCDEALVFDIQAMKNAGFNMLRKHIKVEADRWYYHCDRLGMLVWQDMVSGGSPLKDWPSSFRPTLFRKSWSSYDDSRSDHIEQLSAGDARYRAEWTRTALNTVSYLGNHPSIVTWVLFNEGWGQFCAKDMAAMVQAKDPTRPIDAVSGWYDQGVGDYQSVHNYFRPLEVYPDPFQQKAKQKGDAESKQAAQRAFVLSEFGGLVFKDADHSSFTHTYGYAVYPNLASWRKAVQQQLDLARNLQDRGLSGYVYTQLSDVEEETNGLLTYDRRVNKLTDTEGTADED